VSIVAFWVIPRVVSDAIFDWVVRGRYEKFGRSPSPIIPTEEIKFRTWKF
jgi:predicted DCC family thiol-disulfide oxidoreductase YuxK